ncbi:uncharacterized protein LOC125012475 [Mugil cephalus]|uniref:uncharacterized protein LOC125012475 n=1 Tax=Mugil cephalus TaxID=48193 RepID=UPI001FB82E35|nr:uncharacterized protein LOC125012475 [Mugil cephalus]
MKLSSLSFLCLTLLLYHMPLSLAKGKGGGFGKGWRSKATNRGTNTGHKNNQGSQGGAPKQSGQNTQAGHPSQSGGYPKQQGGGYYKHQPGSPYGGGYGGQGGYRSGHINPNPNNKILSPGYGGSIGYGGYGAGGGSPFSRVVHAQGYGPSDKSRNFGRTAVAAAAGGAVAGMAVGYGIGRYPRPHFQLHSRQEEQHYNHYMHRKYGLQSTDTNDYSRDYKYSQPPQTYDDYMDACMKRNDLLSTESQKTKNKATAVTKTTTSTVVTSASDVGSNTTETNGSNPLADARLTPSARKQPKAPPAPGSSAEDDDDDDDTVSIVEIGYPSLIEQMKVRKCLELYMINSEKYLKRVIGGAPGLTMGFQGLLVVVTSTVMMLLNSNIIAA